MGNPPHFWETDPRAQKSDRHDPKKKAFLRHTHKKYILQKKWSKTAICGLSSCQYILPQPIQGHGLQLDDRYHQYQRDHLVGQSTSRWVAITNTTMCWWRHLFHSKVKKLWELQPVSQMCLVPESWSYHSSSLQNHVLLDLKNNIASYYLGKPTLVNSAVF